MCAHSALLDRLWPFFRHPVVAVRLAVLRILPELAHDGAVPMASDAALASELLTQLFQTFLLEEQPVRCRLHARQPSKQALTLRPLSTLPRSRTLWTWPPRCGARPWPPSRRPP